MIFQENQPAVNDATSPRARVSLTPALIGSPIVAALGGFLLTLTRRSSRAQPELSRLPIA